MGPRMWPFTVCVFLSRSWSCYINALLGEKTTWKQSSLLFDRHTAYRVMAPGDRPVDLPSLWLHDMLFTGRAPSFDPSP